jgi:hypothetical protein
MPQQLNDTAYLGQAALELRAAPQLNFKDMFVPGKNVSYSRTYLRSFVPT